MDKKLIIGLVIGGAAILGAYLIYDNYIKNPTGKGKVDANTKSNKIVFTR